MYNVEEEYSKYVGLVGGRIVSSPSAKEEIRDVRVALGITQEELGRLMGLRRETISRIENGAIKPTFDFVRRFCSTVAVARIVRDLQALGEVSLLEGRAVSPVTPSVLRLYFNMPIEDLRLLFNIGVRGYQKSKAKIIKNL